MELFVNFLDDKPHHHEMRRSKHFWHSVCGPRSAHPATPSEELMSAAITLNCIRTYGMSQSDRNNNIVNNYRLGNIDKEKQKKQQQRQKQQQLLGIRKRRLKSDPLLGPFFQICSTANMSNSTSKNSAQQCLQKHCDPAQLDTKSNNSKIHTMYYK